MLIERAVLVTDGVCRLSASEGSCGKLTVTLDESDGALFVLLSAAAVTHCGVLAPDELLTAATEAAAMEAVSWVLGLSG